MNYKLITWLKKPWIAAPLTFLVLSAFCFYAAWSLNDHKPGHLTFPIILPALAVCIAGAVLAGYLSATPDRLRKFLLRRMGGLDNSGKRNRAIVDALPDMVFVIDREGRYIDFINPEDLEPIVDPEDFLSRKVSDVLPAHFAKEVMTLAEKTLATRQVISHSYQMEVKGKIRSYESRYVPHGRNNVMIVVRDMTEAKIAEQRLLESEYKYRTLVEQGVDTIFIANFQGNFLAVNPAGCKLSQYAEHELLKMRFHDLAIPDDLKVMPFRLAEIASGQTITSERRMIRKDGQIINVEIAARMIAPNRFLAFVRDITERKKTENDLIKSSEHLRQLNSYIENVHETERLNISREIHDDLGQQLAVLKMDISRLGKKIHQTETSYDKEIDGLLESASQMIATVRKISSGLRPSMLDDIGLMATLEWYCDDFSKRTGIQSFFSSDISDDKLPRKLNIALFRIIQESLINVAKHSQARRVNVLIRNGDDQLVLLIEDNGKGFDSTADQFKETPGIRIMQERARKFKGNYKVTSYPGKGTIVELRVPLHSFG